MARALKVTTGFNADGSIAFVNMTVVSADGTQTSNTYDDNGDGVVDRLQTITIVTNPDASTTKTVTNSLGAAAATAILLNQTVTTTSADSNTVTIERDSTGGGWFDQIEVRTTAADGSMTIVTTDVSKGDPTNGTPSETIRSVTENVSADGLTRTEAIDNDGDGVADMTMAHVIVVNPDGSRAETTTVTNPDGSVRSVVTETVSADGQTKTIARDIDGDGNIDTVEDTDIATSANGTTSTIDVTNGDGSARTSTTVTQSDDALTSTTAVDLDGDGVVDVTTVDETVINADESRVNTMTVTNANGSIRSMQQTTLGADKVSSETYFDLNQNGVFEATDLVREVTVDGATGARTAKTWDRNADGSINSVTTSVTSADGLLRTTTIDRDGDSDTNGDGVVDVLANFDTQIVDETAVNGAGEAVRTVTTTNQDGTLRSVSTETTSADGLTTTTAFDSDGDGALDGTTQVTQTNNVDGTVVSDSATYAGDGVALLSQSVSTQSADRHIVTTDTDANGDGSVDRTTVSTQAIDGAQTIVDTSFHADGTVASTQTTTVSANGLVGTTATDADGDGVTETLSTSTTTLDADGGRTQVNEVRNNDGSLRSESVVTVSDDGLTTVTQTDSDGDGGAERTSTSITTLNADGSQTTVAQLTAEDGSLISRSLADTSDDGLVVTQSTDADGDGTYDLIRTTTTTLDVDGGTNMMNEVRDAAGVLRSGSTTTASDDGRQVTRSVDTNGDGVTDVSSVTLEADDGTLTSTTSQLAADGSLQSATETILSANGLTTTVSEDRDGDGIVDLVMLESTTLNADGSITVLTEDRSRDGATYSSSTVTTSASGRTTTQTNDYDADGIADLTVQSDLDIAVDGVQTQTTTRTAANGDAIGRLTVENSADGRTVTTFNDVDGNGHDDMRITATVADDGTRQSESEYLSTGGALQSTYTMTTSGDGRTITRERDRNGDGEIDLRTVDVTDIATNGSVTREVAYYGREDALSAREIYETSDDQMRSKISFDFDGDGTVEASNESQTIYAGNGDVTQTQYVYGSPIVNGDSIGTPIEATITTTTSGDGLSTQTSSSILGVDRSTNIERGADGGLTSSVEYFDRDGILVRREAQSLSADERSSTASIDRDGDGTVEQQVQTVIDLSSNTTMTYSGFASDGTLAQSIGVFETANGLSAQYSLDIDADGTTDILRTTDVTYADNGDMVRSFVETFAGSTVYSMQQTTSADGLSSTRVFDVDGDGTTDSATIVNTVLDANGNRTTTTETRYADGDLQSRIVETVSADGRTTNRETDYDGNGIADKISETVIASDGSQAVTFHSFNKAGILNSSFVTETSSDSLITTETRFDATDGTTTVQTTTRSPIDNGSYTWDNGVDPADGTHIVTTHEVDAFGIDNWTVTETSSSGAGSATTAIRITLDAEAKQLLFEEAASIYDTMLDRDLTGTEREQLAKHVAYDSQLLDKTALINELMSSDEFLIRYGDGVTVSDAQFIAQIYMNALGRVPSMAEIAEGLEDLSSGATARADFALQISDSIEHQVVGNGHIMTNNFDVEMNPALLERNLDEAYVRAQVARLVDVAFDRDATEHELTYLSDRLMNGTETLADVASLLLQADPYIRVINIDGSTPHIRVNDLSDLNGSRLVEEAFKSAFGREPDANELQTWSGHLSSGRISKAEFITLLSESVEHVADGNEHIAFRASGFERLNGSSASETITGDGKMNAIYGYKGNDRLYGGASSDVLHGGKGDDTLYGGSGNDYYVWRRGLGNDIIDDTVGNTTEEDTLNLPDLLAHEVELTRSSNGRDLLITIIPTGAVLTVRNQFQNAYEDKGLEAIVFSDNTVWDQADIFANTRLEGTTAAQTLVGYEGEDQFYGMGGDDRLEGGAGDDTYHWSAGDGNDTIVELDGQRFDIDTLALNGVFASDVRLTRAVTGNDAARGTLRVEITTATGVSSIAVLNQFADNDGGGIEKIVFEDGEIWSLQDILDLTVMEGAAAGETITGLLGQDNINGGVSNDTLNGGDGHDTLRGGADDDQLDGGTGADTYIWSRGDGNDVINDTGTDVLALDHLVFDDVASTEVDVRMTFSGAMVIEVPGANGGRVEVLGQFGGGTRGIERVTFADGITWTSDNLVASLMLNGSPGDDQITGTLMGDMLSGGAGTDMLFGSEGDDIIAGGAGDGDLLRGGLGDDTYMFNRGDGRDIIDESSFTVTEGGVTTIQYDDEGLATKYNPPSGKGAVTGLHTWIHDTKTNATVAAREGGFDTVQFGPDIGIADLIITNEETSTNGNEIFPDRRIDFDTFINFIDGSGAISQQDQLTVRNFGDSKFTVDEIKFESEYVIELETFPFSLTGNSSLLGLTGDAADNNLTTAGGWVTGLAGNDIIVGLADNRDFINGGSGDDTLTGGQTSRRDVYLSDYFIFNEDDGNDIITDFEVGHDTIIFDIEGMVFSDLTIETSSAGAVVRYDGDDSITLNGVTVGQLTQDHFDFA
ncbi:DUF4214 domain-containing protein [Yoonia sp. GPGPB17]|uniref:DUF4214 domain-containing protein n=1 Tax=Yoonia sp. GPGPB17 TaxID=3026147 RepID=UPI0030C4BA2C